MNRVGVWGRLALVFAASAVSGCYKYTAIDYRAAPEGQAVRLLVTRSGAAQFAAVAPEGAVSGTISGMTAGIDDNDLLLNIAVGERREGFVMVNLMQTIRVPTGEILGLERRELDKAGTGLALAGTAALATGIVFGIIKGFGSPGPGGEDPPPDEFTFDIGLFSFFFGR